MNIKSFIISIILIFFHHFAFAENKEKIILTGDYWCPYNCETDNDKPGLLVEIAREIFGKHNIEVEYILKPWNEALSEALSGNVHAVIGASYSETASFIYPYIPQAYGITKVFTLEEMELKYSSLEDLEGKKIGLINGYKYAPEIMEFLEKNLAKNPENFLFETGEDAVIKQIDNLLNKKIDVYLENKDVVEYFLIKGDLTNKIKAIGQIEKEPEKIYIAFTPSLKRSYYYVKILAAGMEELRNSGRLTELYTKYNMQSN